jgi:hypothetical protein
MKKEALDRTLENSLWKGLCTCRKRDYKMLMVIVTEMERTVPLRYLFVQWACLDVINRLDQLRSVQEVRK